MQTQSYICYIWTNCFNFNEIIVNDTVRESDKYCNHTNMKHAYFHCPSCSSISLVFIHLII